MKLIYSSQIPSSTVRRDASATLVTTSPSKPVTYFLYFLRTYKDNDGLLSPIYFLIFLLCICKALSYSNVTLNAA